MASQQRFEDLARPHMDAAFNLAFWIMRNRADAEDVVQTAYLRAFRAFGGFKGEAIRSWLLAIVRNAAYRALQVRKRAAMIVPLDDAFGPDGADAALEIATDEPSAEALLIAECERSRLHAALGELPEIYREIVVLRDLEGLSYAEIAEVAGIPKGTVMSRLSRGRADLRNIFQRCEREGARHAL